MLISLLVKCREHINGFKPCELHRKLLYPDKPHTDTSRWPIIYVRDVTPLNADKLIFASSSGIFYVQPVYYSLCHSGSDIQ